MTEHTPLLIKDERPLNEIFCHRGPVPDLPLPLAFDDACKKCSTKMKRVHPVFWGRRRPYATFQCTNDACLERLFIFDAPREPFMLRSSTCYQWLDFSDKVDKAIEQREAKHAARVP